MNAMPITDVFKGAWIPPWLLRFESEPNIAIAELLVGAAELGHLRAAEPVELLLNWMAAFGEKADFSAQVDGAIDRWIERSWGIPELPEAAGSAALTATAWCRACDVIGVSRALPLSTARLRVFVQDEPTFLDALTEGRARDPLGRAWLALAHNQVDRNLLDTWWKLCNLPSHEPWYRGEYGIHGLRGLPSEQPWHGGGLPQEVPAGLLRLGLALAQRVDERWLEETTARTEFQRIARQTMAAYPFPKKWISTIRQATIESPRMTRWVNGLLPGKLEPTQNKPGAVAAARPAPDWAYRANQIAQQLKQGDPDAPTHANGLLAEQLAYTKVTGDTKFLVRSACNFAASLKERNLVQSLQWAQLAREHEPWNEFAWTTTVDCLRRLGRFEEALHDANEAVSRFPSNPVARTGLAEVLRARGALAQAEAVYQETSERFPDDEFVRNGLYTVRRELTARQSGNPNSAERLTPIPAPLPVEVPSSDQFEQRDLRLLLSDVYFLRRWGRTGSGSVSTTGMLRTRAQRLLEPFLTRDARAAEELGLSLLADGDLDQAARLLSDAARRFPGSARVRYALARARREIAWREHVRLETERIIADVIQPWHKLGRMDVRLQPVQYLGEARSWLAFEESADAQDAARNALGRLGYWTHQQLATEEPDAPGVDAEWAREIQTHLFGGRDIRGHQDLVDMGWIRAQLETNPKLFDTLEEELVRRHSRV
jgi:Flp pilus assembly protein TadD